MANTLSPTAANIISSLGIKGATVNEALPGYVPVLGPDGKLSADFIPADAAQSALPHLSDAAFVDPNTEVAQSLRKGSVEAPYKTLSEAASNFRPSASSQNLKTVAFILAPGIYGVEGNDSISFPMGWNVEYPTYGNPISVYLIGLGGCRFFGDVAVSGMDTSSGQTLVLQNVDMGTKNLTVLGNATVVLLGKTYIGGSLSAGSTEIDGTRVQENVGVLRLSADSYVGSPYANSIEYISNDSKIGNTSGVRGSATVKDALDRLDARKVRVARISGSGSGITAGSSYDVSAESAGGFDVYNLSDRDRVLVAAIKRLYGKFANINAQTVTAVDIEATGTLKAKTLSIDVLKLGGYDIEIDNYGYLVVSEVAPSGHDDGAVILRDLAPGDGRLWLVGVYDGRMFVDPYYEDGSSSSSSSYDYPYPVVDEIDLQDGTTKYKVTIAGGQMQIETVNA